MAEPTFDMIGVYDPADTSREAQQAYRNLLRGKLAARAIEHAADEPGHPFAYAFFAGDPGPSLSTLAVRAAVLLEVPVEDLRLAEGPSFNAVLQHIFIDSDLPGSP